MRLLIEAAELCHDPDDVRYVAGGDTLAPGHVFPEHVPGLLTNNKKRDNCPCCLDPLRGDVSTLAHCRHRCHRLCIQNWWDKCAERRVAATCPLCRHPSSKAEVRAIQNYATRKRKKGRCSVCRQEGHNKRNKHFHPPLVQL
jgi:hypothetical protein